VTGVQQVERSAGKTDRVAFRMPTGHYFG